MEDCDGFSSTAHPSHTAFLSHFKDYKQSEQLNLEKSGSNSHFTCHHTFQVETYVEQQFGVKYTVTGISKCLHHKGFSYKIHKGVPQNLT
ncbi:helix-turn-helix domain-containing protein [Candidatus Enterovibrio escicola]|uniref:helix-turn-helix domain-containing protein n=1 Tax=Candidatus Enterovibrio escicola TaxID=1927127 RepID=UPI0016814327|nr:winged helix-turn-helix domain-containing protein [Candidatus Enterovibrio escacola]